MFGFLLSKPALILDFVLGGIILVFVLYFFYTSNQISKLNQKVIQREIQVQESEATIRSLSDRMVLLQKLNDNFNRSINIIREKQSQAASSLSLYNLKTQALKNPKGAELFINNRMQTIFEDLNAISGNKAKSK